MTENKLFNTDDYQTNKKYGYIYKITFPNVKALRRFYYIGQHSKSAFDPNYLGSGYSVEGLIGNKTLSKKDIKIEVLAWAYDKDELNKLEELYVGHEFQRDPYCLNRCKGGRPRDIEDKIAYITPEIRQRMEHLRSNYLIELEKIIFTANDMNSIKDSIVEILVDDKSGRTHETQVSDIEAVKKKLIYVYYDRAKTSDWNFNAFLKILNETFWVNFTSYNIRRSRTKLLLGTLACLHQTEDMNRTITIILNNDSVWYKFSSSNGDGVVKINPLC